MNKSNKKHFVYIILHIPKTAGTTFHYHICNNFEESEIIFVYGSTRHYNKPPYYFTQEKVKNYLKSIPNDKKDKIKIVLGHDVYMGIHKNFNRPGRYITFLRNPVDRTISFYNHMRKNFEYNRPMLDRSSILSATGRLLNFHEWFERNVEMHNNMTKFFIKRFNRERIGGKIEHEHLEKAKKMLDNFYFIGITENFSEDASFLYHELGVNKLFKNQKISKKYFIPEDYGSTKRMILSKCGLDQELYEHAVWLNSQFKLKNGFVKTPGKCA